MGLSAIRKSLEIDVKKKTSPSWSILLRGQVKGVQQRLAINGASEVHVAQIGKHVFHGLGVEFDDPHLALEIQTKIDT